MATASAKDLSDQDKAALAQTIAHTEIGAVIERYLKFLDRFPLRAREEIERRLPVQVGIFETPKFGNGTRQKILDGSCKLVERSFEIGAATFHELLDGTPYALISLREAFDLRDRGINRTRSRVLAIQEHGQSKLLHASNVRQLNRLFGVLPQFANIVFPNGERLQP